MNVQKEKNGPWAHMYKKYNQNMSFYLWFSSNNKELEIKIQMHVQKKWPVGPYVQNEIFCFGSSDNMLQNHWPVLQSTPLASQASAFLQEGIDRHIDD